MPDRRQVSAAIGGDAEFLRRHHRRVLPMPHVHIGLVVGGGAATPALARARRRGAAAPGAASALSRRGLHRPVGDTEHDHLIAARRPHHPRRPARRHDALRRRQRAGRGRVHRLQGFRLGPDRRPHQHDLRRAVVLVIALRLEHEQIGRVSAPGQRRVVGRRRFQHAQHRGRRIVDLDAVAGLAVRADDHRQQPSGVRRLPGVFRHVAEGQVRAGREVPHDQRRADRACRRRGATAAATAATSARRGCGRRRCRSGPG